jgi:CubicO group peptidase (beta-lactamase class C family)
VEPRITAIEHGLAPWIELESMPTSSWTLIERMKFWRVPAVIDGYRLSWARAWGVIEPNGTIPVTAKTLFQAASISKAVGAMGVMYLVHDGKVRLDGNVNDQLTSWKIPDNQFTASRYVTLRELLSHSAMTSVHGFPGVRRQNLLDKLALESREDLAHLS